MESSGSSADPSGPSPHRWAEILGIVIAILTLTLPVLAIANFSSSSRFEGLQPTQYSLTQSRN